MAAGEQPRWFFLLYTGGRGGRRRGLSLCVRLGTAVRAGGGWAAAVGRLSPPPTGCGDRRSASRPGYPIPVGQSYLFSLAHEATMKSKTYFEAQNIVLLKIVGRLFSGLEKSRRVPSNSDTTATGPMANSLELPITAYTRGGTKLLKGAGYKSTDLGYAEAANGEPSDEITLEHVEGVVLAPVEHWEDVLRAEPDLLGQGLVLVLPQWVVEEEHLPHGVRELGEDVLLRQDADLIPAIHMSLRRRPASNVSLVVFSPVRHGSRHRRCSLWEGLLVSGVSMMRRKAHTNLIGSMVIQEDILIVHCMRSKVSDGKKIPILS
ncbi:hypothetical protein U9M48_006444 [Paspalum notatum var. saurae]|uniref:Uncharacterized protein n=1 Tax=Paspalum notatum var. saurae TaxID=547442 RepID=A0AAQ3PS83_PASNO